MIDLDKMAKEHEKLFPKATLESQVWKLEEEIQEWHNALGRENERQEVADIIIVCGGLTRWCPSVAAVVVSLYFRYTHIKEIEQEVERKWQINLKRKWEWNGKTYHHVEENS